MAGSTGHVVPSLKDRALSFLTSGFIAELARQAGFGWRNTPLALPNLIAWFARQILGGNLSMPALARLAGSGFTPEAFCIARGKLPLVLLRTILQRLCELGAPRQTRWKGHRLWHLDGTGLSMPDTPALQKHFGQSGQQKPGCGFPTAHLLCLFEAASGMLQDCVMAPLRTHDMASAPELHKHLSPGDLLIADRAFESFVHLAMLIRAGVHAIFPAHQKRKIDFRRKRRRLTRAKRSRRTSRPVIYDREVIRRCGKRDHIVRLRRPQAVPLWMEPEEFEKLPLTIEVRELRREVGMDDGSRFTVTLVTTLLDEQRYPADDLISVLRGRWGVELNLRHLKRTMNMHILRSKTVAGIERELWMFAIVYNAVRLVMLEAAERQETPVDRISFADALYWVRYGRLDEQLPELSIVPYRPNRVEPRLKKRRNDHYGVLTRPREVMRKAPRRQRSRRKI